MTYSRARSCSTASEPRQSKEELWEGALERKVGDSAVVQMIGLESKKHIVYARVVRMDDDDDDDDNEGTTAPQVTVMSAIQTMVDEGMYTDDGAIATAILSIAYRSGVLFLFSFQFIFSQMPISNLPIHAKFLIQFISA